MLRDHPTMSLHSSGLRFLYNEHQGMRITYGAAKERASNSAHNQKMYHTSTCQF